MKILKQKLKNISWKLITPDIVVKKSTALCIAGICSVEVPKKLWKDIFDILINASQNNNSEIKITALITLGYIYENIIEENTIEIICKEYNH